MSKHQVKIKHHVALVLVSIFCLSFFSVMAGNIVQAAEIGPSDIKRIVQSGTLRVATYAKDIPPFIFISDENELSGLDIDLAKDIGIKLGVPVTFVRLAERFDDLPGLILDHKADIIISAFSRTAERALSVNFTDAYIRLRKVLLVNRVKTFGLLDKEGDYSSLNDPSVLIGANEGSSYSAFAKEMFPKATIKLYKFHRLGTADLSLGKLHAYLCDEPCANAYNSPKSWDKVKPPPDWGFMVKTIDIPNRYDEIAIATNYEDVGLHDWLNLYLSTIREDGTLLKLTAKYFDRKDTTK